MTVDSTRTIVLLRHAKADWPSVPDHERPLADRGRLDAPAAGRRFTDDGIAPDLALCSTAARTRETWKLVAHELPHRPRTVYEERLYDASLGELLALLERDPRRHRLARCWSATTPACTRWPTRWPARADGDALARMSRIGFPTAAFAVLTFAGSWKSVEHGVGRLTGFWAPHEA